MPCDRAREREIGWEDRIERIVGGALRVYNREMRRAGLAGTEEAGDMGHEKRTYTSEEVSAIVRRALSHTGGSDSVSYEELEEIARQSGIPKSRLDAAIREEETEGQLERARELWRRRRKQHFFGHLRAYLIVNGVLVLMCFATTGFRGGYFWAIWPILGWGIGLAFDASNAFYPKDSEVERGARKILAREKRLRAKALFDQI